MARVRSVAGSCGSDTDFTLYQFWCPIFIANAGEATCAAVII